MRRRPTRSTLNDTLFPYTKLFRSRSAILTTQSEVNYTSQLNIILLSITRMFSLFKSKCTILLVCKYPTPDNIPIYHLHLYDCIHTTFNDRYRSEEHTSELQSLMRISYAVFCLKKQNN